MTIVKIHEQILLHIQLSPKGSLFSFTDFIGMGTSVAIRQSLSRLTRQSILVRLGQGIYLHPEKDPQLGILYPSTEEIAQAIAERDKARIIPTGSQALYKLRLSTQIPMNAVYLTDGVRRKIKLGKTTITFKITTPKKLAAKGKTSALVIQAMQELGKDNIDETNLRKLRSAAEQEDPSILLQDLKTAPAWIADLLYQSSVKSGS